MKFVLFYISFILLVAFLCLGYFTHSYIKENRNLKNKIVLEQEKNKIYILYEKNINCMAKTLMIAYGLSKWESHYYAVIFYDFSRHYNIPWEIYPSVTRVESNFKCNVGSPRGAKGIMQLLEGTGKGVSTDIGIDFVPNQTLWNTLINFVLGCEYLSKNINEKGLEGGVKSYLGGPDYLKSVKSNKNANQYIGEYKTTVWKEYKELSYIFRGIVEESEKDIYKEIHPSSDPMTLMNVELFVKDSTTKGVRNDSLPIRVREKPVRARPAETSRVIDTGDTAGHL
jgi:hypothetical protein